MNIVKPNFLIVGMAKCGTSSLSYYLSLHPEIFISKQKEPRFFSGSTMSNPLGGPKDYKVENWYIKKYEDYLSLFQNASEKAIGEASADTLYFYKQTIPLIKEKLGNPKIIIILRDPVKRSFSAYKHLIRDSRENLNFMEALENEKNRIQQNFELIYHYKQASLYYEPVKAFIEAFPDVLVLFVEDLKKEQQPTLQKVFNFLQVDPDFSFSTETQINVSGKPKSKLLHYNLQEETVLRKIIRPFARLIFPSKTTRESIVRLLSEKNLKKMTLEPEIENVLREYFRNDIKKLSKLLDKDLSFWF